MSALLLLALLATPPDTLVVGLTSDPVTLDPHRATDLVSAAVVSNVCEPLVRYRADGSRPEAALATSWATADSRTWTIKVSPSTTPRPIRACVICDRVKGAKSESFSIDSEGKSTTSSWCSGINVASD